MKGLKALLLIACVEPLVGFSVRPNLAPVTGYACSNASSSSLRMGLGSFVRNKFGRGSQDEKDKKEPARPRKAKAKQPGPSKSSSKAPPPKKITLQSTAKTTEQKREMPLGIKLPPDERNDGIRVPKQESVSDRIKRTQAGQMTEAEKQAFLMTSLGQKPAVNSRINNNATPLPKDSILKQVMTGKKDVTPEMISEEEKQKEAYLNMVTNPNRFKGFEAAKNTVKTAESSTENSAESSAENPAESSADNSSTVQQPRPNDLGSRLEAAAISHENQQKELRKQVAAQRQETLRRNQEIAKKREEDIARQEERLLKERKATEAKRAAEAEERARIEAEKKAELERRQDEYWKKQLELEKAGKLQTIVEEQNEPEVDEDDEQIDVDENTEESQFKPKPQANVEEVVSPPAPAPSKVNTFVEQQALRLKEIERKQEEQLIRLKALNSPLPSGPPKGLVPQPAASPGGLRRSLEKPVPLYNDVRTANKPQATQPQSVVNDIPNNTIPNPVGKPAPAPAPRLDLRTLVGQSQIQNRQGTANAPSQPVPQQTEQPAARADLKSLMNQRAKMDAETTEKDVVGDAKPHLPVDLQALMRKRAEEDAERGIPQTKLSNPSSNGSGFLGRVFGGGNKQRTKSTPAIEEPEEEPELPVEIPDIPKRQPIRQKLNIEDYDDEDDVDFEAAWNGRSISDVAEAKAASLSDEDKSKMFGIDMSKFSTKNTGNN